MKILIISQEPWYAEITKELRRNNDVDYIYKSTVFKLSRRDYQIPKLFGFDRGYILLAYIVTSILLFTKRYDVCLTDYKSIYFTTMFPFLKKYTRAYKTNFIYDMRTIPVGYADHLHESIESKFKRRLLFANKVYQGITVITEEMKSYLEKRYLSFEIPVGIWESGVDVASFNPLPKDMALKKGLGFDEEDFVCFYHGSLGYKRGVIELVESFRFVKPKKTKIKLLVLGRGESQTKMQEIIFDYCLTDTVKIHDWVDNKDVPKFLSIADLCIIPLVDIDWWRVSSPLKLMEYIACGKNILMTDIIAHTSVVGGDNNYFWIHDLTPENLAGKIIESFKHYEKCAQQFVEKGQEERVKLVDKISWRLRAELLESFFDKVHKHA